MKQKTMLIYLSFFLVALINLVGEIIGNETVILCTKPLLMQLLAVRFLESTPGSRRFLRHTVLAGLIFAVLGDIFMLFSRQDEGSLFFLLGLGAFLITHICYLGGFLNEVNLRNGFLRKQPLWAVPFLLFLAVFLACLWPGIPPGLRLPVLLYGSAITSMALSVVNLRDHVGQGVFQNLLYGALLFLLSDVLLGIARFGQPFAGANVAVVASYLLGQWLIVLGVAGYLRQVPERLKK